MKSEKIRLKKKKKTNELTHEQEWHEREQKRDSERIKNYRGVQVLSLSATMNEPIFSHITAVSLTANDLITSLPFFCFLFASYVTDQPWFLVSLCSPSR